MPGTTARLATATSNSATTNARSRRSIGWGSCSRGRRPTRAPRTALEIKGDLAGALEVHAPGRRRHLAQRSGVASVALRAGRRPAAATGAALAMRRREYRARRGDRFPTIRSRWPDWRKIKIVEGDLAGARLTAAGATGQGPDAGSGRARSATCCTAAGDATGAEQYFRMAEQIERAAWGNGPAQPQVLARFLADHDRDLAEAVTLAEAGAISRRDIFTMDTLAWSYFKAGRLDEARAAMAQAVRTGSVDARILYHAAEIQAAAGEAAKPGHAAPYPGARCHCRPSGCPAVRNSRRGCRVSSAPRSVPGPGPSRPPAVAAHGYTDPCETRCQVRVDLRDRGHARVGRGLGRAVFRGRAGAGRARARHAGAEPERRPARSAARSWCSATAS